MSTDSESEILVLGAGQNGIRLSPDEFDSHEEWDENYDYELITGVLVVSPPPPAAQRGANEHVGYLLRSYRESHPQGSALDATLPSEITRIGRNRRRADRAISAGLGRWPNFNQDTPTIVVEFVSPGRRSWRRDYEEKRDEYLAAGVKEYWVIDRFRRTMTVYRPKPANGAVAEWDEAIVRENEVYRSPLLPGFELPLAHIFRRADELS